MHPPKLSLLYVSLVVGLLLAAAILVNTSRRSALSSRFQAPTTPAARISEAGYPPPDTGSRQLTNQNLGSLNTNKSFTPLEASRLEALDVRVDGQFSKEETRSIIVAALTPIGGDQSVLERSPTLFKGMEVAITNIQERATSVGIKEQPDGTADVHLWKRPRGGFVWVRLVRSEGTWVIDKVLRWGYS